ncbi:hypothetical protein JKP88DRAFT_275957 [Tribonema minus]|uniref:Uncharacterized protein n=1 Tax=Tribonema minus TaxID=303371 RepID=A0A835ZCY3_9STRA|nr:hypothetical protein JKP88DRAFT_275957 [Tribonema minus]
MKDGKPQVGLYGVDSCRKGGSAAVAEHLKERLGLTFEVLHELTGAQVSGDEWQQLVRRRMAACELPFTPTHSAGWT